MFTPGHRQVKIKQNGEFGVRCPKLMKIIFLFLLSLSFCQKADYKLFSDVKLHPISRKGSFASKQTIEGLLYEIWNSGFIRKNNLTQQEILNNAYGVFRKAPKTLSEPEGRAYYQQREGKKDLLMLNAHLFGHLEPAPKPPHMDKVSIKRLDRRIRATLVHELFHDFWHNILDESKRYLFTSEAEIFFIELMLAKTELEKQQLLSEIGIGQNDDFDFESFEVLLEIKDIYNLEKLGTELFSTLAGRAFSGNTIIPKHVKKYYSFLLSDEFLDKDQFYFPHGSGHIEKIQETKKTTDVAELKISLEEEPELINSLDKNGFTLLHHAAYSGNLDAVQLLVKKGADIYAKAKGCAWTPFFLASLQGHLEISEAFIKTGMQLDDKDRRGRSFIHYAAQKGHRELLELLLQYGARVHSVDAAGMTPLHMAALCGRHNATSFLISKGANTKSKDFAGQTPLHLASFGGNKNLAELLISKGAEIDERDNKGETALHIASFCGHEQVVEFLIGCGAKLDGKNIHGKIPEELAALAGFEKIVNMLRSADY
jgi:ankyrin repeat protein